MAFIIDTYNKYDRWDRQHARYVFEINENWSAIMEVEIQDGLPVLPTRLDDINPSVYFIHNTYEDALSYVKLLKSLN